MFEYNYLLTESKNILVLLICLSQLVNKSKAASIKHKAETIVRKSCISTP